MESKTTIISLFTLFQVFFVSGYACANHSENKIISDKHTNSVQFPLVYKNDLEYIGAFRVPNHPIEGSSKDSPLSYGGSAIYYIKDRGTLLMVGHAHERKLLELTVPKIIKSEILSELDTAKVVQPLIDITDGHLNDLALDENVKTIKGVYGDLGGFLVYQGRLIGTAYGYYDAAGLAAKSHFTASPNWAREGSYFKGLYRVGVNVMNSGSANGGFVGGYMAHIPKDRQDDFGQPAITGQGGISIISRSSYGPCAWTFDPAKLGEIDPVPATMLVGYPQKHQTLGFHTENPELYFSGATKITGLIFPQGTDSILFFGRHGLGINGDGRSCYGIGVNEPTLHGTENKDHPGVLNCYDMVFSDKGSHAYPYVYRVWAYDAKDLLKVKKGDINPKTGESYKPWDVQPYAIWDLNLPFLKNATSIIGAAYDADNRRIFVSQASGERAGYERLPVIHVFRLNIDE